MKASSNSWSVYLEGRARTFSWLQPCRQRSDRFAHTCLQHPAYQCAKYLVCKEWDYPPCESCVGSLPRSGGVNDKDLTMLPQ